MEVYEALRRFRQGTGLKQEEVAERLGIMRQAYQPYETGKVTPSVGMIKKIATAFNVSADYLLGLSDEPRPWEAKAETSPPMEIDASTLKLIRALQEWRHEGQVSA